MLRGAADNGGEAQSKGHEQDKEAIENKYDEVISFESLQYIERILNIGKCIISTIDWAFKLSYVAMFGLDVSNIAISITLGHRTVLQYSSV